MVASRRLDFAKQTQLFRIEIANGCDWETIGCVYLRAEISVGSFCFFGACLSRIGEGLSGFVGPDWVCFGFGVLLDALRDDAEMGRAHVTGLSGYCGSTE
jgi:hypothetical protein